LKKYHKQKVDIQIFHKDILYIVQYSPSYKAIHLKGHSLSDQISDALR